jgi:hypothetical protein
MIDAAARLFELLAQPVEAELLAPLVRDEILIRLLRSPMGSRVAQIGQTEGGRRSNIAGGAAADIARIWQRRHESS